MKTRFARLATGLVLSVFSLPLLASAGSITPASVSATIGVGETIVVDKTVTTDPGLAVSKVDVYFLADNTGSMGTIINSVKTDAAAILAAISGGDPRFTGIDVQFGVGHYVGDPSEYGLGVTTAFETQQTITSSAAATIAAINGWGACTTINGHYDCGGDWPEANFFALSEVATEGAMSGSATGWRPDAGKIVVWFGDAPSHTATVTQAAAIAALNAAGITVAAINTLGAGGGIDTYGQASAVAAATGGTLTNGVSSPAATIDAILAAVASATATVDISLAIGSGDTSGLGISFACVDPLGCTGVGPAESRDLTMTITGLTAGLYEFTVYAPGIRGAVETDSILVGAAPEPASMALLGIGLAGMGFARRRRATGV